jgi:hypothetical protein
LKIGKLYLQKSKPSSATLSSELHAQFEEQCQQLGVFSEDVIEEAELDEDQLICLIHSEYDQLTADTLEKLSRALGNLTPFASFFLIKNRSGISLKKPTDTETS